MRLLPLSLFCIITALPAAAQDEAKTDKTDAPKQPEAASQPAPASGVTLTGGVQTIEVMLQEVREIALALKRVRHAAENLYDEVTQQPINYSSAPNVVGATVINIPVNFTNSGFLVPRKKWIDHSVAEMRPIIAMMKQEIDDVIAGQDEPKLPPYARDSIKDFVDDWVKAVNELDNEFKQLDPMTSKEPLDNGSIGKMASEIHETTFKMEKIRKSIYKELQKDAAQAAKSAKK